MGFSLRQSLHLHVSGHPAALTIGSFESGGQHTDSGVGVLQFGANGPEVVTEDVLQTRNLGGSLLCLSLSFLCLSLDVVGLSLGLLCLLLSSLRLPLDLLRLGLVLLSLHLSLLSLLLDLLSQLLRPHLGDVELSLVIPVVHQHRVLKCLDAFLLGRDVLLALGHDVVEGVVVLE